MTLLVLALACQPEPAPDTPVEPAPPAEPAPMSADDLLTRMSIDLRGALPSLEEYAAVAGEDETANLAAADALAAQWVNDERFGDQVGLIYADVMLTRQDSYITFAEEYELDNRPEFVQDAGDVPLKMIAHIANADLPWTEAVTGDWTVVDETLAALWPVDYPPDASGWQAVTWNDGRPPVGILGANSLWWRYSSTESNANRGRANATSRIFLCNDYVSREIPFDPNISLVDEEAVQEALATQPACVACHVSVDPLAGYFFGFYYYFTEDPYEIATYHPEREGLWESYLPTEPGYFGQMGGTLYDLGRYIAADDRFVSCAVKTVYQGVMGRPLTVDDDNALVRHREAFITGGLTFQALYSSIVRDAEWRAAPAEGGTRKLLNPDQLASVVEDLTRYRMRAEDWDVVRSDLVGVRLLAGGVDGINAMAHPTVPTTTLLLVQQRLAESAAQFAVAREAAATPNQRTLLTRVAFTDTPEANPDVFVAQMQDLGLHVLGERWAADSDDVTGLVALWQTVYATDANPNDAWAAVITALLRDPALLEY